jgi:hypothetical protein
MGYALVLSCRRADEYYDAKLETMLYSQHRPPGSEMVLVSDDISELHKRIQLGSRWLCFVAADGGGVPQWSFNETLAKHYD